MTKTINRDLEVDGSVSVAKAMTVTQSLGVNGNLASVGSTDLIGPTTVRSTLSVAGTATFAGSLSITGGSTVTGGSTIVGNTSVAGQVFIDQNGNSSSLVVDSEATTANVIDINGNTLTTGTLLDMSDLDAITTGRAIYVKSNSGDNTERKLVEIHNQNVNADTTTCLEITNAGEGPALNVTGSTALSALKYGGTQTVITNAAPATLTTLNSGSVFTVNTTTGVAQTLPDIDTVGQGAEYTFVISVATAGSINLTTTTGDFFIGMVLSKDVGTTALLDGQVTADGTSHNTLLIPSQSVIGSWIKVKSINATMWFVSGMVENATDPAAFGAV